MSPSRIAPSSPRLRRASSHPTAVGRCRLHGLPLASLLLAGLLTAIGCGPPGGGPPGAGPPGAGPPGGPPPALPVTIVRPVAEQVTEWDTFTARLRAVDRVELRARVSGALRTVHFEEGAQVAAGDLLMTIDPRPFEAELRRTEAELAAAETALARTERELERARLLFEPRAISEEEFDARQQARDAAEASRDAAQAERDVAALDVTFTQVRAPIAGRVGRAVVTEGNLVRGGDADGTHLATLVALDPIDAYFSASETLVLRYARQQDGGLAHSDGGNDALPAGAATPDRRVGPPAYLQLSDETGFPHAGAIDFIDNEIDRATGTLEVRARFANPDHLLLPGMFATVRIPGRGPYDALLIPDAAVLIDQTAPFVYVAVDGPEGATVARRAIELGTAI
ncbi:MAG: efflux RND transporter periplasmic adaptor subunit, partial [Acidobacteriota bacterium]